MLRTKADEWFSKCVRARAGWRCERCQRWHGPGPGLDCSHFIGRGKWATRFEPLNASALCRGCHGYFTANPHLFMEWFERRIGKEKVEALMTLSLDVSLGKRLHHEVKEMAAFYEIEYGRMMREGLTEFAGFFEGG